MVFDFSKRFSVVAGKQQKKVIDQVCCECLPTAIDQSEW